MGALIASGGAVPAGAPAAATFPPAVAAAASDQVLTTPVRHVRVKGATLGYRKVGTGRPLVLITGVSATMAAWDPALVDRLARRRPLVVFDNRGVATSTGSVAGLTIRRMARDTARLIAKVAGGRADVLGWSMGSYIAQELALRHPARVRRLVLAASDGGGRRAIPPRPWAIRILADPTATQAERLRVLFPAGQRDEGRQAFARVTAAFAAAGYQPADAFTISSAALVAQNRAAGPRWVCRRCGTHHRLHRLDMRVLIAAGRRDVVTPVGNAALLAERIPHARVVEYGAGHGFVYQPELRFAKRVNRFLDR